ncbi:hypothetical protein SAZ_00615 [Streptomyces noursei ZPM]|uniref:Antitoxin n=1 Tax=Streptomyces noursei TaxID=1971 RepID=A0A401QS17_STRNR|nr:hypothetical protein [Streptomyces noursei]AKA01219.1 hypothetical protein SAZ_00615 [Streptomyces noursei ZPM]EPY93436.1 hypothetical protein K530_47895 [Streptomyces noursei CCRC 11814]EXU92429.1 hypothetical protein P354_21670 [Streptomyces noursei PD-1]MCZ0971110.1 hypothetical protein [Streptomyces noursei]GCB88165.1 hypothetical protein SALB_00834 [Streptomyces noursei]
MPSLNVTFTDDEMHEVRAAAAAEGKSLKQYLHDLPLRETHRLQFVRHAVTWGADHQAEFDEAFPDEVPPPVRREEGRGEGRAA